MNDLQLQVLGLLVGADLGVYPVFVREVKERDEGLTRVTFEVRAGVPPSYVGVNALAGEWMGLAGIQMSNGVRVPASELGWVAGYQAGRGWRKALFGALEGEKAKKGGAG